MTIFVGGASPLKCWPRVGLVAVDNSQGTVKMLQHQRADCRPAKQTMQNFTEKDKFNGE
jgi:hypothetical protein